MFPDTQPKVLVVDDEPAMCALLEHMLEPVVSRVETADSATKALEEIERGDFDVVLCDVCMPGVNGLELLSFAQQAEWDLGIILVTGYLRVEQVIEALRLQAADFLAKPFTAQEVCAAVSRTHRRLLARREARAYQSSLETSIQRRTCDLERALQELEANYQTTLEALVAALDAREHETCAHSFRVRTYTLHLARLLGYPLALLPALGQAALLHDIGKVAVTDSILLKRGTLTPDEWVEMRKHAVAGAEILERVPFLRSAAAIVRHHHEHFDGSGYPHGLAGDTIPLGARIFAFADTLDAITSDRPYRKAIGFPKVREEIERLKGTQFDPRVTDTFLRVPETIWKELRAETERGG
jgi:putative nucleotidyltransferase with HDIG domain